MKDEKVIILSNFDPSNETIEIALQHVFQFPSDHLPEGIGSTIFNIVISPINFVHFVLSNYHG